MQAEYSNPPKVWPLWQWLVVTFIYALITALWATGCIFMALLSGRVIWWLVALGITVSAYACWRLMRRLRRQWIAQAEQDDFWYPTDAEDLDVEDTFSNITSLAQIYERYPHLIPALAEMIAFEQAHGPWRDKWDGWEWKEVHTAKRFCNQLLSLGLLDAVYDSNKSTNYRLRDLAGLAEEMAMLRDVSRPANGGAQPRGTLFRYVYGLDPIKNILNGALDAEKPVHVLLIGPPGSAKSLMIGDIGGLPNAEFYAASQSTRSGLVGLLLDKRPRFLVLDEIDKCRAEDTTPLLNLMEGGIVTVLQSKRRERVHMLTSVFAAANSDHGISPPLLSRFLVVRVPAYTRPEFLTIARSVLMEKDGIGAEVAKLVAEAVAEFTLDVRQARHVAQIVRNNPGQIDRVLAVLFPQGKLSRLTAVDRLDGQR